MLDRPPSALSGRPSTPSKIESQARYRRCPRRKIAPAPQSLTHNSSLRCGAVFSMGCSRQAAGEEAKIGEVDPGGAALDGRLEVFGEASAAAEPGETALD